MYEITILAVRRGVAITGYTAEIVRPDRDPFRFAANQWRDLVTQFERWWEARVLDSSGMKFAFWRAIPNTGALKVHAVIHDADSDGPAYAIYAWDWTDVDPTSPGDFYDVMKTEVNEHGGMVGGATFQGIVPYPVPGYDLAWIDDSPGG